MISVNNKQYTKKNYALYMFGFWFMSLSFSALNIGMSYHASVVRKSIMLLIDHMPFWCIVFTNTKGYLFLVFCFLIRWRINQCMNQVKCFLRFFHVVICLGIFCVACHLINDIIIHDSKCKSYESYIISPINCLFCIAVSNKTAKF